MHTTIPHHVLWINNLKGFPPSRHFHQSAAVCMKCEFRAIMGTKCSAQGPSLAIDLYYTGRAMSGVVLLQAPKFLTCQY